MLTHSSPRYIYTYINSFFSLPVKRQSGEHLSHEEVVDQLDDQTVLYEVYLGVTERFAETLRVTIRVEVAKYDLAVAWLKDLLYGSEFVKERCVSPSSRSSAVLMTTEQGFKPPWPRCSSRFQGSNGMGAPSCRPFRQSCYMRTTPHLGPTGSLFSLTLFGPSQRKSIVPLR